MPTVSVKQRGFRPDGARRPTVTESRPVKIALLGCGTVGGGVIRLIRENASHLASRVGAPLELRHVLVRDANKARVSGCDPKWLTIDPEEVFNDDSVDLVVEVVHKANLARKVARMRPIGVTSSVRSTPARPW